MNGIGFCLIVSAATFNISREDKKYSLLIDGIGFCLIVSRLPLYLPPKIIQNVAKTFPYRSNCYKISFDIVRTGK